MTSEKQPLVAFQKWYDESLSKKIQSRSRNISSNTSTNLNFSDQIMMEWNDEGDPEEKDIILKEIPQWTRKEIVITAAAAAASTCALLSLLTAYTSGFILLIGHGEALLCSIAGALGMTIPVYSAYQEQKITDFRALQKTNVVLSHERDSLKQNCDRLHKQVKGMEDSVKNLGEMKETLRTLQQQERTSLEKLERQLVQKKILLKDSDELVANRTMDNVFAFIERSDTDYDGHYKEEEIRAMIQQVEATIHIDVDEELLADKLKEDQDGSHDIGDVFSAVQDSTLNVNKM